jgi:hypothetical protein
MGNGAIVPFFLMADPDDDSELTLEEKNKATISSFYRRVYDEQDLDALESLVTSTFAIHRDGRVQRGRAALREQIEETMFNTIDLRVRVHEMVAAKNRVAYRLNVTFEDVSGNRKRTRGISISRLTKGRIAETWVSYEEEELDT